LSKATQRIASRTLVSSTSVLGVRAKSTLPDLPYDYGALEPVISGKIMELHHSKHHQTYVNGLNTAEEQLAEAISANDVKKQISLQAALKFNGGGHINHSLFWPSLIPEKEGGGHLGDGELKAALESKWGGLEGVKERLNAQSAAIQGSGWGWLGYCRNKKTLVIETTANQDPLLTAMPLLGIDMWEHAYYLQYYNVKVDYLKQIWKIINWKTVEERYLAAKNH